MGGVVSGRHTKNVRQRCDLTELKHLDLVLIRTKLHLTGFELDARIAQGVRHTSRSIHMPPENDLVRYDRVGFIEVPGHLRRTEYSLATLRVWEATANGVVCNDLDKVCQGAEDLVIRRMLLPDEKLLSKKDKKRLAREEEDKELYGEFVEVTSIKGAKEGTGVKADQEGKEHTGEGQEGEVAEAKEDARELTRLQYFDKFRDFVDTMTKTSNGSKLNGNGYLQTFTLYPDMYKWISAQSKQVELKVFTNTHSHTYTH